VGARALTNGWLVAVDFDGTVSVEDTLELLCTRYAPEATERAEAALVAGEISLEECIRREFEPIRAEHAALVAEAVGEARVRDGFAEFVAAARGRGHRVVVVSSGFESLIRPVLERAGVGDLELVANDVRFSPDGTRVLFHGGARCERCGERCKRPVVAALDGDRPVAYVGDGWSDRCAAADADLRFACGSLARYLDGEGLAYVPFDTFHTIREHLP
jgi:2-hydroxy-3-keto-5-methylthiopentenyl-1-phosphate phosphatase